MQILEHSSMTQTGTSGSSVTPTERTNSGKKRKASIARTAYALNRAQHLRLQQELALANYQRQYCQHLSRVISQAGVAAARWWPWTQPLGVQNLPCIRPPNVFPLQWLPIADSQRVRLQGSQEQEIISSTQGLQKEFYPYLIAADTVSTPDCQRLRPLRPKQSVQAGAKLSNHQLQQYPKYFKTGHVVTTSTNPATLNSPKQNSQVTESGVLNLAITVPSITTTSTVSLSSNSSPATVSFPNQNSQVTECGALNLAITVPSTTTSTVSLSSNSSPATVSSPNQHSQVTESGVLNLAITVPSTTTTSTESLSSNSSATVNLPNQHSQVTEWEVLNLSITATSTTTATESLSSNSDLNNPLKMPSKDWPNCRDPEESNSEHLCPIPGCDKVYSKTWLLQDHILSHAGGKPFICNWPSCEKRYKHHIALKRHRKTHTSEGIFQCTECTKIFRYRDYLSNHLKTHRT